MHTYTSLKPEQGNDVAVEEHEVASQPPADEPLAKEVAAGPQGSQPIGLPNAANYDHIQHERRLTDEAKAIVTKLPLTTCKGSRK